MTVGASSITWLAFLCQVDALSVTHRSGIRGVPTSVPRPDFPRCTRYSRFMPCMAGSKGHESVPVVDGDEHVTPKEAPQTICESRLDFNCNGVITKEDIDSASASSIMSKTNLYKELTRQTRLDVFDYRQWEQYRSSDTFFTHLGTFFGSRVIRSIWKECAFSLVIAALVCLYNSVILPVAARRGLFHGFVVHLPMLPWTIASSFLSLLLVFRTNASYQRWSEARAVWGSVTNTVRDIGRQLSWRSPCRQSVPNALERLAAFGWALQAHVGGPVITHNCNKQLVKLLGPKDLAVVQASDHKPMALLGLLTTSVDSLEKCPLRRQKLDMGITQLMDNLGKCERIFKTPIPRIYTKHTERFLGVWLATLPIGMYDVLKAPLAMLPAMLLLSVFLLGINELANQIEEPFSILPLDAMCNGIHKSIEEDYHNSHDVFDDAQDVQDFLGQVVPR